MLGKAYEMVVDYHKDQLDKSGKPYILHLVRVSLSCKTLQEQTVGMLHDIVEDTVCTVDDIRIEFGQRIAEAVDAITKREGESLEDYLTRVNANPIAREVKLADMADNLSEDRLKLLSNEEALRLIDKYNRCAAFLEGLSDKNKRR